MADFPAKGWTADEYLRASKPLANTARVSLRNPEWWLRIFDQPEIIPTSQSYDFKRLQQMEPALRVLCAPSLDLTSALELQMEPTAEMTQQEK